MPISYGDAAAAARGDRRPGPFLSEWRGNLPLTYHIGPGPAKVHLKVIFQLGHQAGLRRDRPHPRLAVSRPVGHPRQSSRCLGQWRRRSDLRPGRAAGRGALDVRACQAGWKPKRTIIFCAWDGEEPGLLGSTEWVETHRDELRQKAVIYVNSDSNGRGFLGIEGSHTLEHFINNVAQSVPDPETSLTVWKRAQLYQIAHPDEESGRAEIRSRPDLRHRRTWRRLRLCSVSRFCRHCFARSRFLRRVARRRLPFDLRRFLLVYPLRRHHVCLWPRAFPNRRDRSDAHGRCRAAALRLS